MLGLKNILFTQKISEKTGEKEETEKTELKLSVCRNSL